jgi:uncharacterized 2Fe-2S/4Fe-4S cluster protein (DUF4445 family)
VLSREQIDNGYVLACQSLVTDSPCEIRIPQSKESTGGKFTDRNELYSLIDPRLIPAEGDHEALTKKVFLQTAEPQHNDGLADIDRVHRALTKTLNENPCAFSREAIVKTTDVVRAQAGAVTVTVDTEHQRVIDIEPGNTMSSHFGAAIDIGTTTVAVDIIHCDDSKIAAHRTGYNEQISCGLDIISRINYARKAERREEIRTRVLSSINTLLHAALSQAGLHSEQVSSATISGNTTMIHLLLGCNPEYIRREPYTPTVLATPSQRAADIGIDIAPSAPVRFSPAVGSYVGGDITAGVLCTPLALDSEDVVLFLDIGTNGELVIGNSEFCVACACSAGPAFEGGGIGCGMRAADGAIEQVRVDPQTAAAQCETIGGGTPRGICGSGMIGVCAHLLTTGWIDGAGKLDRSRPSRSIEVEGRRARYILVDAAQSGTGEPIYIDETDIENILRAKAAIYAAASLLLSQLDLDFSDCSALYIGGGFGRFLDLRHAVTIGLLPDLPLERFHYLGNSSLAGTAMCLVSRKHRTLQTACAQRMTYIDLNTDPAYMDQYTAALFFPHTDIDKFPSVNKDVVT